MPSSPPEGILMEFTGQVKEYLQGTADSLRGSDRRLFMARTVRCLDAFCLRGRKRAEEHLPRLLTDIKAIVDAQCQTDPSFQTQRLYTRLTAATVRHQLIAQKGYTDEELPSAETIRCKIHQLGYRLRKVQKCKPKKR